MSNNHYKIDEFQISDHPEAVQLWDLVEGVTLNESDSLEAISTFLNRNFGFSFIARNPIGEVIGTVLCGHNGRAGQIYHLVVASEHRGNGLARKLIELSFKKLRENGVPRCNIFVYSDNEVGNEYWLKTGWNAPATWKVLQKYV
jgi:ribosomal protein S18 acetylase RimI-like enzyme